MVKRGASWYAFWGAVGMIVYIYAGFPLLAALRSLLRPRAVNTDAGYTPPITMVIPAYNEEAAIGRKLENTLTLDYPPEELQVLVASDGSNDRTVELVHARSEPRVQLLNLPRQGKNRTLNDAVKAATGEILVFSDADTMLDRDALRRLLAPFADRSVGGVGGDYRYATEQGGSAGERVHWSSDRWLKGVQSRGGSMTSASGGLYALRRDLYRPLPDGVTDDFFASIQAPAHRLRLVFEPNAVARGPIAETSALEYRRKVRVITAGLRGVWSVRHVLNPLRYGFFALQLLTHKVLRRLTVVPLLVMAVCAPLLWRRALLYRLATVGQAGMYGLSLLGWALRDTRLGHSKLLSLPLFFGLVNLAALAALRDLLRGRRADTWVPQRAGPFLPGATDVAAETYAVLDASAPIGGEDNA